MGILLLEKRVNCHTCSFSTKQHMFGVFAINEPRLPDRALFATLLYHIKVLVSAKFLESWLDHFPLMKLANKSASTPISKFCFRRGPYSFAKLESSHLHKTREDPFTHYWGQEFFIWVFPSNRGYIGSLKVVSYFYFRLWKCLFWSEEKQWKWLFLTLPCLLFLTLRGSTKKCKNQPGKGSDLP